jgi:hypothetical protein
MENTTRACLICRFSHLHLLYKGNPGLERYQLECRRHCPVMVLTANEEDISSWPYVSPDDFCGDFEAK